MKYHFKIHKETKGYWAECVELEGCLTQSESRAGLESAMGEALNIFLAESDGSEVLFPPPQKNLGKNVVAVEVDPSVALALGVRQARLKMKMTQKQMKDFLGIKTLSNYQRLEDPKRANPELKTLVALAKFLPDLSIGRIIDSYSARPSAKRKAS